jgi:APA family basic amino acid/polyamine antiporter
MGGDGLLPPFFCAVHPRFRTPWLGTMFVAGVAAIAAATLPIAILGDLVSLGTGVVFLTVAISTMWLRSTQPDLPRPFRVPGGGIRIGGAWIGIVPTLSILMTLAMIAPVLGDILYKALHGDRIPAIILVAYIAVGGLFYRFYGLERSRLGRQHKRDIAIHSQE